MVDSALVAVGLVGGLLLAFGLGWGRQSQWLQSQREVEYREGAGDLEESLRQAFPKERTHLESPPSVRFRSGEAGTGTVAVIRTDLGMADTPSSRFVFEFAADMLTELHPKVDNVGLDTDDDGPDTDDDGLDIAAYDLEFTFGPGGLFVSGECRRISVPIGLVKRLCSEPTFRAIDLQQAVEEGAVVNGTPAVSWGACGDPRE